MLGNFFFLQGIIQLNIAKDEEEVIELRVKELSVSHDLCHFTN